MKYLILCEGTKEVCIINLLLKYNKLKFTIDDLVSLRPFNVRQLSNPTIKSELLHYNKPVEVLRIGDKQNDKLLVPEELSHIVSTSRIKTYCTLPELEILLIINEGLFKAFQKTKESPKTFAKRNIIYNKKRYDQSNEFLEEYFGGKRINNLCKSIKKYKQLKKHMKNQLYLADLLK